MATIVATEYKLPQAVISNGQVTGNPWNNPDNILLVDGDLTESNPNNTASDIQVGNFLTNLAQNAVITGIEMKLIAKSGAPTSPPITLQIDAIDNSSGSDVVYPYISPISLSQTLTEYILGTPNYLFNIAWTPDMINNIKLRLMANGDIYVDSILLKVYYYIPDTDTPVTPAPGTCISCDSPIQIQAMQLQVPFLIGQTKFYLKPGCFCYPNGVPVQPGDVGECGGKIPLVFDQGKSKSDDQNYEENAVLDTTIGSWRVLANSGVIEVDLGDVTQRGRDFKTPGGHVASLMSDHDANSSVIVSNNTPYNLTLIRTCQIGTLVSKPIITKKNNAEVVNPTVKFNFTGAVNLTPDSDPEQVNINIPGSGTIPPSISGTGSGSSGNIQVPSLTFAVTSIGVNRLLVVQVSTEQDQTITGITYNGVALTHQITETDAGNNLRTEQWTLVAPALGTHDVIVSLSGIAYISAGAECVVGVDQSTPVGSNSNDSGASLTPTTVLTTTYTSSLIFSSLVTAQTPILFTPGAGQNSNWSETANSDTRQGGSAVEASGSAPDAVTLGYAITQNTNWCMTGIEVKGITTTPPPITGISVQDETGDVVVPNTTTIIVPDGALDTPSTGVANLNLSATRKLITQTAHGFSEGNIVRNSGIANTYTLSQADTAANAEVTGYVDIVIDVNKFVLVEDGYVTGGVPAQVAKTIMFLSDVSAGDLTDTEPTDDDTVSKPLLEIIENATLAKFTNYRGQVQNGSTSSSTQSANSKINTNGIAPLGGSTTRAHNAGTGVMLIPHGLSQAPNFVKITAMQLATNGSTPMENLSVGTMINGGAQSCTVYSYRGSTPQTPFQNGSNIIQTKEGNSSTTVTLASITAIDATNVELTFTTFTDGGASANDLFMQLEYYV